MSELHLFFEIIASFLAAVGLLSLGWILLGHLLAPVGGHDGGPMYAVLPASGGGDTLEHDVLGLLWLRGGRLVQGTIVIADCGLNPEGRKVAMTLAQREYRLTLCMAAEVEHLLLNTPQEGK